MTEDERREALKRLKDSAWKELRLRLGRPAAHLPEVSTPADRAADLILLLRSNSDLIPIVDAALSGAGLGPAPWSLWMEGLAEEYARIPLIGFNAHREIVRMQADAIYLDLRLMEEQVDPRGKRLEKQGLEEAERPAPVSIEEACRDLGKEDWGLAIVGRPGSGENDAAAPYFYTLLARGQRVFGSARRSGAHLPARRGAGAGDPGTQRAQKIGRAHV